MAGNAGLGIGSTGFAIAMCGEIIRGYRFFCTAKSLKDDFRSLLIRMRVHQTRFITFCHDTGLYGDGNKVAAELKINTSLFNDILEEIRRLLEKGASKNSQYLPFLDNDASSEIEISPVYVDALRIEAVKVKRLPSTEPSTIAALGTSLSSAVRHAFDGGYLSWGAADAEAIQKIVGGLADMNQLLTTLLSEARFERLLINNEIALRVELQQYVNPVQIAHAIDAFHPGSARPPGSKLISPLVDAEGITAAFEAREAAENSQMAYVQKLSQFRQKYFELGQQPELVTRDLERRLRLDETKLFRKDDPEKFQRPMMVYRPNSDGQYVWIEWKERVSIIPETLSKVECQMQLLADLACSQKPQGFPTPTCLGYFREEQKNSKGEPSHIRLGLAFASPTSDRTLYALKDLSALLLETSLRPSMTQRDGLCSALVKAVLDFHTVGWIHKNIRSSNIIFWSKISQPIDLSSPLLGGIQFSRPDEMQELSIRHDFSNLELLHKHPGASEGAQRLHDIYSLGLLLIEVILWKPLCQLLQIPDIRTANKEQIREAHGKVKDLLTEVAFVAGDYVTDTVKQCIEVGDHVVEGRVLENKRLQRLTGEVHKVFAHTTAMMTLSRTDI